MIKTQNYNNPHSWLPTQNPCKTSFVLSAIYIAACLSPSPSPSFEQQNRYSRVDAVGKSEDCESGNQLKWMIRKKYETAFMD